VQRALRIIVPLPIQEKAVVMVAGRQFDSDPSDAVCAFSQIDWLLLPVSEIAHQLHAQRRGC
jgi:hypothetical protein